MGSRIVRLPSSRIVCARPTLTSINDSSRTQLLQPLPTRDSCSASGEAATPHGQSPASHLRKSASSPAMQLEPVTLNNQCGCSTFLLSKPWAPGNMLSVSGTQPDFMGLTGIFVPSRMRDYFRFAAPSSAGGCAMVTGAGHRSCGTLQKGLYGPPVSRSRQTRERFGPGRLGHLPVASILRSTALLPSASACCVAPHAACGPHR